MKEKKTNPVRIERMDSGLYSVVKRLSVENKRTIAGQAEWMILQYAKQQGFLNHVKDYDKAIIKLT